MLKLLHSTLLFLLIAIKLHATPLDWQTVRELANKQGAEKQRIERDHRIAVIGATLDRRSYWPTIKVSGELPNRSESLRDQLIFNPADSTYLSKWVRDKQNSTSYSASISQSLPFGISLNANGNEWKRSYSIDGGSTTDEYGVSYSTDMRWSPLSGDPTGRGYRNAGTELRELALGKTIRDREFELSLLTDYISFLNADGQRRLAATDAAIADTSRTLAERKYNGGLIPQTEYLTLELSAQERKTSSSNTERNYLNIRDNFFNRLGLSPQADYEPTSDPGLPQFDTAMTMIKLDPQRLPEARRAKLQYERSKRDARAGIYPLPISVELRAFQTWDGRAANRHGAVDKLSESRGGALSIDLDLLNRNEWFLRKERTTLTLREVETTYRDALRDAERQVREAERKWLDARERLVSAEKLLQLSKLRESMTASRYALGTVSTRDLLEAQQDRLRTELSLLSARGDWIVAALRLQRLKEESE